MIPLFTSYDTIPALSGSVADCSDLGTFQRPENSGASRTEQRNCAITAERRERERERESSRMNLVGRG